MKKEFPYKRILVIDDNEIDFFLAHRNVMNYGSKSDMFFAMDVDSGMAMYKSFKPEDRPDLILLDLSFGRQGRHGIDFLKEFRALPSQTTAGTEVVVLTAYAKHPEGAELNNKYQGVKVLEKPFLVEKLLS